MRIYIEIARDVRKKVGPDFPVTIRLSGTDYEPDGFPIEDKMCIRDSPCPTRQKSVSGVWLHSFSR